MKSTTTIQQILSTGAEVKISRYDVERASDAILWARKITDDSLWAHVGADGTTAWLGTSITSDSDVAVSAFFAAPNANDLHERITDYIDEVEIQYRGIDLDIFVIHISYGSRGGPYEPPTDDEVDFTVYTRGCNIPCEINDRDRYILSDLILSELKKRAEEAGP